MSAVLYHPDWGYYRSGQAQVGRTGDFFTNVSVGACFGLLLARRLASWWHAVGCPRAWRLIEQGSHDGQLLADVLEHLPDAARSAACVTIIEPSPALQALQAGTLARWSTQLHWHNTLQDCPATDAPTAYFCNELLDAFPVERIRWQHNQWQRLHVQSHDTTANSTTPFVLIERPLPEFLQPYLPAIDTDLPNAYTTEICPGHADWANALANTLPRGLILLMDYGFESADYYHPSRQDGTLRTYCQHRALDNPFQAVGYSDITAHVCWSEVVKHLTYHGFCCAPLLDQGRYLTRLAAPWLLEMMQEGSPPSAASAKLLRQFQTLTHPSQMGAKFQVLEATKL